MWYVYILRCNDDSLYTGITKDVAKRFAKHQSGTGSKYTRSHPPQEVIFTESVTTRADALKREYEIKQLSKEDKLSLVNQHN